MNIEWLAYVYLFQIGFSVGALVITECLKELAQRNQHGIVDNVVLMGAPLSSSNKELWDLMSSVVSNRMVNCYSPNDWVLGKNFTNMFATHRNY